MFFISIEKMLSSNTVTLISQTFLMMLFHTKYPCVVTGKRLNTTAQEIMDVKRNFRLQPYGNLNVIRT